jgi:photosystem II stability/assembly factor-like uncharacterized protein
MRVHARVVWRSAALAVTAWTAWWLLGSCAARAQDLPWQSLGPSGGDVRSLAADPHKPLQIYLGTSDGHVFGSADGGEHWQLLGRVGDRPDGVVAALVVDRRDSQRLFAALWTLDPRGGGGVYSSEDGGRHWRRIGLAGEAVRALAQAASAPATLVAGTLTGVFRSNDGGAHWERISPPDSDELRNLDSVAIDPRHPATIYVGTFHLPWKTVDGGRHWFAVHRGMVDDSDVFSLVVDPHRPERVFASACTGIYRSDDGGAHWRRIHGIPSSARRTQVIVQDPGDPETIYAGTTEGLWKTTDGGASWRRLTPSSWVINALLAGVGHAGRLLVGTEQLGVLVSEDGGLSYRASNSGFNHRRVLAATADPNQPGRVLAIVSDAPDPVVVTTDSGRHWQPLGTGLRWQAVRGLYATPRGWWAALQTGGLFRYDDARARWVPAGELVGRAAWRFDGMHLQRMQRRRLDLPVFDLAVTAHGWYAATPQGLLISTDDGETWGELRFAPLTMPVRSLAASADGQQLWLVTDHGLVRSGDGGRHWQWTDVPFEARPVEHLVLGPGGLVLAATRRGLYLSRDGGHQWEQMGHGLPQAPIRAVAVAGALLVASVEGAGLYVSVDAGQSWRAVAGKLDGSQFPVLLADPQRGLLLAASASDGLYALRLHAVGVSGRPAAGSLDPLF